MAWARMFEVALRSALWTVAETMGGRAILTLALELVLYLSEVSKGLPAREVAFGFDCPLGWMQGVSIRVCSQPLLLWARAPDVMQKRREQQSSLVSTPHPAPSATCLLTRGRTVPIATPYFDSRLCTLGKISLAPRQDTAIQVNRLFVRSSSV